MVSTSSATSTAGSPPSSGCGTRSTSSTSRRLRTSAFTTASTCASVPWRRGQGYDVAALDERPHRRSRLGASGRRGGQAEGRRSVARCARSASASASATRTSWPSASPSSVSPPSPLSAASRSDERRAALRDLAEGEVRVVFTVDLFNEGVDVPNVDTLLLLRPTDSPTLFLQQLGRGLRKADGKGACTVLDFVGTHRKEFRFDRRFRALLGGSRADVERQVRHDFPFLPAGCSFELDPVAQEIVLRSIREAIPSTWRERCEELRSLGDVEPRRVPREQRARARGRLRRRPQLVRDAPRGRACRPRRRARERRLLRAVGRLLHVDDDERLDAYPTLLRADEPPSSNALTRASSGSSACWSRR